MSARRAGRRRAWALLSLAELDGEEPLRALEAFELDLAALAEVDARADNQLAHEVRNKHLAPDCAAGDACGVVHGRTVEVIGLVQRVSGVDADPHADRRRGLGE